MKLSVIVPFFNVENYLGACLDSVLHQDLSALPGVSMEVILIDDGSSDLSRAIASQYAAADARLKLITQENSGPGPGAARNRGFEQSSGDYIIFVDSDDVVLPGTFAALLGAVVGSSADFATINAARIGPETRAGAFDDSSPSQIHEISHPLSEITDVHRSPWLIYDNTPWTKCFKRSFFSDVIGKWPSGVIYEDMEPMTRAVLKAKRIAVLEQVGYLWRKGHEGAITTADSASVESDLVQLQQILKTGGLFRDIPAFDSHAGLSPDSARAWFEWKALTGDMYWMLLKILGLGPISQRRLLHALASTLRELNSGLLAALEQPLRSCYLAVMSASHSASVIQIARQRLSLRADTRTVSTAMAAIETPELISAELHDDHVVCKFDKRTFDSRFAQIIWTNSANGQQVFGEPCVLDPELFSGAKGTSFELKIPLPDSATENNPRLLLSARTAPDSLTSAELGECYVAFQYGFTQRLRSRLGRIISRSEESNIDQDDGAATSKEGWQLDRFNNMAYITWQRSSERAENSKGCPGSERAENSNRSK